MMIFPKLMMSATCRGLLAGSALLASAALNANAQQTTGVPGSPGAARFFQKLCCWPAGREEDARQPALAFGCLHSQYARTRVI